MEQYLALIQYNIRPGIVKPEIDGDIKFKINGNFMRELRRKLFKGLDIPTHIRLDSKGFIPLMSPAQAHKSIQVMADHSHNWYDEETTRECINDSSDNVDTKKLKENIHAIQVSRKICEGAHPTNDCPLTKEDKAVEQSKYMRSLEETIIKFYEESIKKQDADDEWIKKFIKNTDSNIRALKTTTKNLQEKADHLTQTALTNSSERSETKTKMVRKDMKEPSSDIGLLFTLMYHLCHFQTSVTPPISRIGIGLGSKHNTTRTNNVLPAGITFVLPALTIT
ncbi:hypothetical protein Tco_0174553 [Tanacetum coccineum]